MVGEAGGRSWIPTVLAGLGVALAVAVFLSPFASEFPDGLEFVGQKLGFLTEEPVLAAGPRADARLPASASQPGAREGRDGRRGPGRHARGLRGELEPGAGLRGAGGRARPERVTVDAA